jgi:(p)ppGpp synthase/HD superfamily hydrolase
LDGQSIEVQIRTSMMHTVAEYGMASHWAYTESKRRKNGPDEGIELYKTPWLSSIKEWQNDRISSRDFVDSVRRELLGKRVFVFLRNGKILNLSRGATAIDAAFQIHTAIGLTMHGVEINGKPVPLSYELRNGDVVSILTGKGKPATDWMRYAKSRSTRSKLRAYFRARQKESLREAGKLLIMDYLWMHGPLIEEESYREEDFKVPTLNVEELQRFLPGRTQFEELDDLLIALGKHHDRNMLHKLVSQMFELPKKVLVEAEEKNNRRYRSGGVVAAVLEGRRRAQNAAKSLAASASQFSGTDNAECDEKSLLAPPPEPQNSVRTPTYMYTVDKLLSNIDAPTEYADPEHLCKVCLPVHGDAVVGTRRPNQDPSSTIPTVHRMGCPHAQKAINRAWADQRHVAVNESIRPNSSSMNHLPKVDSFTLRQHNWTNGSRRDHGVEELPVKLEWSDLDENNTLFLAEIVVIADDRKLLLADCSEVVSETVEIVKTGSTSTEEHAMLVFLVQVTGLDHIQQLMDRLGNIRSVMSVERRFGSELLL